MYSTSCDYVNNLPQKRQPFILFMDSAGQEFGQGTVGIVCPCCVMSES